MTQDEIAVMDGYTGKGLNLQTSYLIGHSLKLQADASYNHQSGALNPNYNRWEIRFQVELGL